MTAYPRSPLISKLSDGPASRRKPNAADKPLTAGPWNAWGFFLLRLSCGQSSPPSASARRWRTGGASLSMRRLRFVVGCLRWHVRDSERAPKGRNPGRLPQQGRFRDLRCHPRAFQRRLPWSAGRRRSSLRCGRAWRRDPSGGAVRRLGLPLAALRHWIHPVGVRRVGGLIGGGVGSHSGGSGGYEPADCGQAHVLRCGVGDDVGGEADREGHSRGPPAEVAGAIAAIVAPEPAAPLSPPSTSSVY